jgi:hypothetical protein
MVLFKTSGRRTGPAKPLCTYPLSSQAVDKTKPFCLTQAKTIHSPPADKEGRLDDARFVLSVRRQSERTSQYLRHINHDCRSPCGRCCLHLAKVSPTERESAKPIRTGFVLVLFALVPNRDFVLMTRSDFFHFIGSEHPNSPPLALL